MKIFNTRIIIIFLFSIFVFVNFIFLIKYYYKNESVDRENKKKFTRISDNNDEEAKILQKIVDFNNTSFENNGVIHFYNAANQKVTFKTIQNQLETIKRNNEVNNTIYTYKYFYDKENKIFIDSELNFCKIESFDHKTFKCSNKKIKFKDKNFLQNVTLTDSQYEYIDDSCDEKIKCCIKEYECLNKCFETYKLDYNSTDEIIFKNCKKTCEMKIYTKSYKKPFCYLSSDTKNIEEMNITLTLSDSKESCEETCSKRINKKCYNHLLSLINSCDFLLKSFECNSCQRKEIYGPALENITTYPFLDNYHPNVICYFSTNPNTNCNYRDDLKSLRRVCPCL